MNSKLKSLRRKYGEDDSFHGSTSSEDIETESTGSSEYLPPTKKRRENKTNISQLLPVNVESTQKRHQTKKSLKLCPVPDCTSKVLDLPRHLKLTHKWSKEKARTAVQRKKLRKVYTFADGRQHSKKKDYHKHRPCPVAGCLSVVKRLPPHLSKHHKIDRKSGTFKDLLNLARRTSAEITEHSDDDELSEELEECEDNDSGGKEDIEEQCVRGKELDDDDVESDDEYENIEQHNDSGVYTKQKHCEGTKYTKIYGSFSQWLQSADGGRKNRKSSNQHAHQVFTIVQSLQQIKSPLKWWDADARREEINQLLDKTLIRDRFLTEYVNDKKFEPGTTKSYLGSLRHFYVYLISENILDMDVKPRLESLQANVTRWIASYKTDCLKRGLKKHDIDLQKLVTPEQVSFFERSAPALTAIKIMGEICTTPRPLSQHQYVLVRNFIIAHMTISNAHRSGVLANLTMGEFKKGHFKEDSFIISVYEHKTASTQGPAKIILTQNLHRWLAIYVSNLCIKCIMYHLCIKYTLCCSRC